MQEHSQTETNTETDTFPRTVVVVGGRRMARGVVMWMLLQNRHVTLIEENPAIAELAHKDITAFFESRVEREIINYAQASKMQDLLTIQADYSGIEDADFVIECGMEDMGIKRNIYTNLAASVGEQTIIASNTSSLEISRLAELVDNPGRFLGTHFFYPVAANPIVELIRGNKTDPGMLRKLKTFFADHGKNPVITKDSPGFVINRFVGVYINTAHWLMDELQLSAASIDEVAIELFGSRQGPMEVSNWLGTHNVYRDQVNLSKLGNLYAPSESLRLHGENREPIRLGDAEAISEGQQKTIRESLLGSVFLSILQILDEGIATAEDVDLCASLGLRFEHAPCALMDSLGKAAVQELVQPILDLYGDGMPMTIEDVGHFCQTTND